VDWNLPDVRPLGPDLLVFFGVRRRRCWCTVDVATEKARPVLVIRVTNLRRAQQGPLLAPESRQFSPSVLPVFFVTLTRSEIRWPTTQMIPV
jgi:hypothetical protein